MLWTWLALSASALAEPTSAVSVDGWTWPQGTVRTFHLESLEVVPGPWQIRQRGGLQSARTNKVRSEFVLQCTAVDQTPRAWELECEVLDAAFIGTPVLAEDPRVLETVLGTFATLAESGTVDITMGRDGRVLSVDLDGLNQEDQADRAIVEWIRLRLILALSGLDVGLPPAGVDGWTQRDHLWAMSPYTSAIRGGIRVENSLQDEAGLTLITSKAQGTLSLSNSTAALELNGLWKLQGGSQLTLDREQGAVVSGSWALVGLPTASAGVIEGDPYLLGGSIRMVGPNEPVPTAGPSGLWGDHFEPGEPERALVALQVELDDSYDEAGFRSRPYLWAQVGPTYHFKDLRENPLGAGVTVGLRLPLAISVGVGAQWDQPARFRSHTWIEEERQLYGGLWYESNYRITPRVGIEAGASHRSFSEPGFPEVWMPFFALDLGLQWRPLPSHWLSIHTRAPIELGYLEIIDSRGNASFADKTSWVVQLAWTVKLTGRKDQEPVPRGH